MKAACAPPRARPPSPPPSSPPTGTVRIPQVWGGRDLGRWGPPSPALLPRVTPEGLPTSFPGGAGGQEGAGGCTEDGEPAEQRGGHPGFWGDRGARWPQRRAHTQVPVLPAELSPPPPGQSSQVLQMPAAEKHPVLHKPEARGPAGVAPVAPVGPQGSAGGTAPGVTRSCPSGDNTSRRAQSLRKSSGSSAAGGGERSRAGGGGLRGAAACSQVIAAGAQGTREAEASLLTRSCLVLRSTFLEKRVFSCRCRCH